MRVLGIYADVPDPDSPDRTHAWIVLHDGPRATTYSLYSANSSQSRVNNQSDGWNGSGTHVRENFDLGHPWTSRRLSPITPEQERAFRNQLEQKEIYGTIHNNCAHFAARVWTATTGETLGITHQVQTPHGNILPAQSPVGLASSIDTLENVRSTSALANVAHVPGEELRDDHAGHPASVQASGQAQEPPRPSGIPAEKAKYVDRLRRQWSRDMHTDREQSMSRDRGQDE